MNTFNASKNVWNKVGNKNFCSLFLSVFLAVSFLFGAVAFIGTPTVQAGELQEKWEEKTLEAAKNIMLKVFGFIEQWVSSSRTRVAGNARWSDSQKSRVTTVLDNALAWITDSKAKIEAATDKEALKTLNAEIKSQWQTYKTEIKMAYAENWVENGEKTLSQWEDSRSALQTKIDEIKSQAQAKELDISTLDSKVSKLDSEIEESKTKLSEAMAHIENMKTATGQDALTHYLEARAAVITSITNLVHDGRQAFGEVTKEILNLYKQALEK